MGLTELPPSGLLLPYLGSEQSTQLARAVVFALAPSRVPRSSAELECFGKMINQVALQPVNFQSKVHTALAAWVRVAPFITAKSSEIDEY